MVAHLRRATGEPSRNFEFPTDASVPIAILGGAALSFYALIGFEDAVNVAEETEDPARTFPPALFGGILAAGVIYLLVTFTASMIVPTAELAESDGPLLEVVEQGPLGIPTKLFALIALLAVANGALINLIMASRLLYGMANQGILPAPFGRCTAPGDAVRGDHLHHRAGHDARDARRPERPGGHDHHAAALHLHRRQRRRARAPRATAWTARHFVAPTAIPDHRDRDHPRLLMQRAANNPQYFLYAGGSSCSGSSSTASTAWWPAARALSTRPAPRLRALETPQLLCAAR